MRFTTSILTSMPLHPKQNGAQQDIMDDEIERALAKAGKR